MPENSPHDVSLTDARAEIPKEIYAVVKTLVQRGFKLRRQGHKYGLYCPWIPPPESRSHFISIPGTPKNPGNAAKRIEQAAKRCPDKHE